MKYEYYIAIEDIEEYTTLRLDNAHKEISIISEMSTDIDNECTKEVKEALKDISNKCLKLINRLK